MARKRDNTRRLVTYATPTGPVFAVQNGSGETVASAGYSHGSREKDKYALVCITIRLDGGKSYELIIRPSKVELLENKHGN
jgi:hypothetical protein